MVFFLNNHKKKKIQDMKVMNLRKLPATPAASFATLQMASEANTDIDVSNNVPEQDQILL